jgi:hypothetical protein
MNQNLTKLYEGAPLSGATANVIYIPILFDCELNGVDVLTDENVSGANAVFSLKKNGVTIGGAGVVVNVGQKIGSVVGLDVALTKGDEIILNLASGAVSSPVTLNLVVSDGVAAPADGADGQGVPAGGAAGQILAKASEDDFDTLWIDQPAGGSGGGGGSGGAESDYISGLNLEYVSANQVKIKQGAAALPGGTMRRLNADLTKTLSSPANSTKYYLYLYDNSGTTDVEFSTTPPEIYNASAARKTGDSSRRFIGYVLTNASGDIFKFLQRASGDTIEYHFTTDENYLSPLFEVVTSAGGVAGVPGVGVALVTVSLAGTCPEIVFDSVLLRTAIYFPTDNEYTFIGIGADISTNNPAAILGAEYGRRYYKQGTGAGYDVQNLPPVKLVNREVKYFNYYTGTSGSTFFLYVAGYLLKR